eukprot:7101006-Heterocapsa_arctica.AAC.1
METEFKQWDELSNHVETSDWQLAIREAYGSHEVLQSKDKEAIRRTFIERLGSELDRAFGSATTQRSSTPG